MLKLLLFTTLGGFSGGGMYLLTVDLYRIYISKTQLYSSNLSVDKFFNEGMFYGVVLGFFRWYNEKPLLDIF